ncbi:MAG: ROK family protein [Mycobacterium sp.]
MTVGAVTVGIDLGGTGTRIVLLDVGGNVVGDTTQPTAAWGNGPGAVVALTEAVLTLAGSATVSAVGIGASGPVDADGIIRNPDTLPAFSDVPLTLPLSERLGAPCVIDNDAATAALGEYRFGAGRGCTRLLMVTLGTGIGVGVLTEGRLFKDAHGLHPEAGHLAVAGPAAACYCGLPSCWEQLASRTALRRQLDTDVDTAALAARAGSTSTLDSFRRYGDYVAAGLSTLMTVYGPDRVVIGGGAAQYWDLWRPAVESGAGQRGRFGSSADIVVAHLGTLTGAIGAAALADAHRAAAR